MGENINIEEIEQYLDGLLEGDALLEFQQRLQEDKNLAARVRLMQRLDNTLLDEKAIEVQNVVQVLGGEFFKSELPHKKKVGIQRLPFYRRLMAVAAVFLLLIALSFVLWRQANIGQLSNQELYTAYYAPYKAGQVSRGEDDFNDLYDQAIQEYNGKNYKKAISLFKEGLVVRPGDVFAVYTLGHAYLNLSPPDFDNALTSFRQVINDGKSIHVAKSQWYVALIYLKQDKRGEAKEVLTALIKSEDAKVAAQAKELLGKLD